MTLEEIATFIEENKIEVSIFSPAFTLHNWNVTWKKTVDGMKLEISKNSPSLSDAMREAFAAWSTATRRGIPELTTAQLEHNPQRSEDLDDEIPF